MTGTEALCSRERGTSRAGRDGCAAEAGDGTCAATGRPARSTAAVDVKKARARERTMSTSFHQVGCPESKSGPMRPASGYGSAAMLFLIIPDSAPTRRGREAFLLDMDLQASVVV